MSPVHHSCLIASALGYRQFYGHALRLVGKSHVVDTLPPDKAQVALFHLHVKTDGGKIMVESEIVAIFEA